MIRLENIHVRFNRGEANEVHALKGIDLNISAGEFTVVIGSNGSGKSTLLNVLAGTVKAESGNVILNGENVSGEKEFQRSRFISRIFQDPLRGTAPDLSILDNFRLASLRTKPKTLTLGTNRDFIQKVKEKISILNMGLQDKIMQPVGSLSGGQRQALTLVMATMDDCKIMLLDEPTAALDPRSSAIVMGKAAEIISQNKITALLITHQMKDALQYGNRLIMMREGNIFKDFLTSEKAALKIDSLFEMF